MKMSTNYDTWVHVEACRAGASRNATLRGLNGAWKAEAYTKVSEYDTLNLALEQSRLNSSNWLSFPVIVSPSAGVTIQSCLESGFVAKVVLTRTELATTRFAT